MLYGEYIPYIAFTIRDLRHVRTHIIVLLYHIPHTNIFSLRIIGILWIHRAYYTLYLVFFCFDNSINTMSLITLICINSIFHWAALSASKIRLSKIRSSSNRWDAWECRKCEFLHSQLNRRINVCNFIVHICCYIWWQNIYCLIHYGRIYAYMSTIL